jgi:hypothetical protein
MTRHLYYTTDCLTEFTDLYWPIWFTGSWNDIWFSCFFFFLVVLGFDSGPTPWASLPAPLPRFFFVMGAAEIGSHELFAQAGFKQRSSWSLPPELLAYRCEPLASGYIHNLKVYVLMGFPRNRIQVRNFCSSDLF